MKEHTLIEMLKEVKQLKGIVRALLGQIQTIKDLSSGTLETLKRMPGYEEGIEKLKKDLKDQAENNKDLL
tara:strand:- start:193 stop:402 length:210 start_codon:yes stop_codon:yes gene_type:complete